MRKALPLLNMSKNGGMEETWPSYDHYDRYCKIPKYYVQDCLKTFLLLPTLSMVIQVSRKTAHLMERVSFIKFIKNY